jgi:hypothetical protein
MVNNELKEINRLKVNKEIEKQQHFETKLSNYQHEHLQSQLNGNKSQQITE